METPGGRFGVSKQALESFCQRNRIQRVAFFGAALRPDFRADSDVDILVEFEYDYVPEMVFTEVQDELSEMFGRRVNLQTLQSLGREFRDTVISQAQVLYSAPARG